MGNRAGMTTVIEERAERLIGMSRAVLDRLERGDRLSAILPQARAAAELYGNGPHVHWLDCEIYGMQHVPFAKRPRQTEDEKAGLYLLGELRRVQDVRKLSVDGVLRDWPKAELPDRDIVVHQSVGHLERAIEEYRPPAPGDTWAPAADQILQLRVLHSEHRRILDSVRAYLYQYMDKIWSWAVQERNNVKLLGPDYRIVVDSLEALQTGVGQELLAALSHLRSTNPAEWALSALACRNVVLSLGRTLFPLRTGVHHCAMLGKDLELKGEKELNWLTAFIDFHWQTAADEDKRELHRLGELARRIYETGSRGKNKAALGHTQVQELVAHTFRLVSGLKEITGFEPLDATADTGG
jgi:hypothetical protein